MHRRRRRVEGVSEDEARRSAARVVGSTGEGDRDHPALDGTRLHRDDAAAELAAALGADAVTVGRDVYRGAGAPGPGTDAGRRLLVHELTHLVQQQRFGPRVQRFTAAERPLIAKDLAAMMAVVDALVTASSRADGGVDMDALVRHAGGRTATAALPATIRSDQPKLPQLLTLRYLFTRRAGLIDMRHFVQLMYISWFTDMGDAAMAARGATRRGVEHEQTAEPMSKFGPEDLTSNALGAWTATRLAALPQRDDVIARIRETLARCAPVDFSALSPASQVAVVGFYAAQSGAGEPLNQNTTAVALVPAVPELAGTDRSFPFTLDDDDPRRATIDQPAFGSGAAGLTGDSEIREFVAVQRPEVIREIPAAEKARLGARLLTGWVSDDDLAAFERLYRLADPAGRAAMRAAVAGVTLSGSQNTELRAIFMMP